MQKNLDECFYGSASVGERGQIVIPIEARNQLGIKPGDKLLIMKDPHFNAICLVKFDELRGFLDVMSKKVNEFVADPENAE